MVVGRRDVMRHPVHTYTLKHSGSVIRRGSMKEGSNRSWTGDRYTLVNLQIVFVLPRLSCYYIYFVFPFQSPNKRKVLTSQRTFDSEGEKKPYGFFFCFFSPNFATI